MSMPVIKEEKRRWWILAATSGVLGLSVLDETIVGVALVTIQSDLGVSTVESHWVVNAYLLTFTCFVAVGGRLSDALGPLGPFLAGAALFGLSSLICAIAPDGALLIAGRASQGIGTATLFPAALAMITSAFPPDQRGLALGIQTTVAAIFMASGPLLGGTLTEILSWRWIFWINLPLVAIIAAITRLALAGNTQSVAPSNNAATAAIDYPGLVCLIAGLCALVTALMQSADWGWRAPGTLFLFACGTGLLSLFVMTETRANNPLIQLKLFRITTFTGGSLVFFSFQFAKMVAFVFVALFLQEVMQMSPIATGSIVAAAVLPTLITSVVAGRLADRYGSRPPLLGGLFVSGLALIFVGIGMGAANETLIVIALVAWGAMLPFLAVTARRALMSAVPAEWRGQAGGVNLSIQMLGGTVGIALASIVLAATGNYQIVFFVTGAITLVTMLCAWFLIER